MAARSDLKDIASSFPEALGVVELTSLIRGYRVLDAMIKRSPVTVRAAYPVSTGKFLIFVEGGVAEVEEAMHAGVKAAGEHLLGELFLPFCHPQVWDGLFERFSGASIDALGLFESTSVADAVLGADTALKAADVDLVALHLARGIGGRAYFVVAGPQHDAEAALDAAMERVRPEHVIEHDLICAPHDEMTLELLGLQTVHVKY